MVVDRQAQEAGLDILVENKGFDFIDTFHPYTSGEIGPYYVQCGDIQRDGDAYVFAVRQMTDLIRGSEVGSSFDVVAGGESRDWIFSGPVAVALGKPHVMIYKNGKIVGGDMNGQEVVHVADLNNQGSSPRDLWVPAITDAGGTVQNIFFYVDRMEKGTQVMGDLGLNSQAVVPLDEHAWGYLEEKDVINNNIYDNLRARMEDADAWAEGMLRSDAGLDRLGELLQSERDHAKGVKILDVGYPGMKAELLDRLGRRGVSLTPS
jgi:orotate phosphoribosyltransferase